MIDPVTDMFNRIRNAQAVDHPTVDVPFSNLKYEIAKILEAKEVIGAIEKKKKKTKKVIRIVLKYKDKISVISELKRISKPGRRVYFRYKKLKPVKSGYGFSIISTPKGLMTNEDAKKKKLGGEIICEIW